VISLTCTITRRLIVAFLIVGTQSLLAQVQPARKAGPTVAAKPGTLVITAALVDRDMQVRPVPLHALALTGAGADTVVLRTAMDGKASLSVPPGTYTLTSVAATEFQGQRYRWKVGVTITPGATVNMALANDNATVEAAPAAPVPSASEARVDPAAALFERLKGSVFRIQAGLAHGSGFLADTLGGVVITNSHVVEAAQGDEVSAVLDSATRVRAQVLARDPDADIAVLRLPPDYVAHRFRVPLQHPVDRAPVVAGERLAAMGYPLNQGLTITSGIASSVRAGAIISDVNINHGNSGGPLLNVDGEAVAVNTFGDLPDQGGPGVSGSILIARAGPALARAAAELAQTQPPSPDLLPVMPVEQLEMATVKAEADTTDPDKYRDFADRDVAGFQLTLQTPIQTMVAVKAHENEVAKDRKKREARAGLPEAQRFSEVREYRDWAEYVGAPTQPVVSFAVIPKVGETGGSIFKRMMLGPNLRATYKFKGDVRGVQVFRNRQPVEPIKGGHSPVKMYVDNQWVTLKDVADAGFYVFDVEVLRPDSTGAPPSIVVAIRDLKSPNKLKCTELPTDVVAMAWNDFEPFYQQSRPRAGFRGADPKTVGDRTAAWQTDFLKNDCDWS
jgi:S1-C subfamily serine protease